MFKPTDPPPDRTGCTILVIDDNLTNLTVAFEHLEGQGFTVLTAKNGESGLKRAQTTQPDLILMDVMMPGMDGFETCRCLKREPTTAQIPVIFMTALNQEADKVKGFEAGGVDYITKPIQATEMLARIKVHLQLNRFNQTLEQQVKQRTQELSQALANLQTAQQDLIQSEKMAALGQLTASIAHEINTPMGVIRGATSNIMAAFQAVLQQLPLLFQRLSPQQQTDFLALVHASLQQQQSLPTQAERQLRRDWQTYLTAQGIANPFPLATHLTLLRLTPDRPPSPSLLTDANATAILAIAYNLVTQHQNVNSIQQEVDRATKIVFALKTYSYPNALAERCEAVVTEGIEVALTLYHNRLKRGITVIRHYDAAVTPILCNPDELTQVWVNLVDNAIYAMNQQGTLEVSVTQPGDRIIVAITDSGCGIPAETQSHIFEPFFTTKPRGKGSGLGLDIVRQIVHKHGGAIQVQSRPGRTTFTVTLPVQGECNVDQI